MPPARGLLYRARSVASLGLAIWLCWLGIALPSKAFDIEQFQRQIPVKARGKNSELVRNWIALLSDAQPLPENLKLQRVNEFFNRNIQFEDDQRVWGQADYWATPLETLLQGAGDCEDYGIAKFFTLRALGIPAEKLRLVYVRARIGGPQSSLTQAHMVLAYYITPDAEPQVLDNLITDIRAASRRTDLTPIFSFNTEGIWAGADSSRASSSDVTRLSRWRDLLARAKAEGFE